MITSTKGKEMLKTVSPIYHRSKIMQSIFQAIGTELEIANHIADEVLLQMFPQTATWGLRYWEELLDIPVNESTDINKRRALVMARIKLRSPVTPKRIAEVIKTFTEEFSKYVEVTENVEPHVFQVIIGANGPGIDYSEVYRMIKKIKPSHESFYLGNIYSRGFMLKSRRIFGLSEIIHAIGTFVCSKENIEFMATKGHRNSRLITSTKRSIRGKSTPLVISKTLVSRIRGHRFIGGPKIISKRIVGTSDPLVCREDLKFFIDGLLSDEDVYQYKNKKRGKSNPLACSKSLKFTRIEVVK